MNNRENVCASKDAGQSKIPEVCRMIYQTYDYDMFHRMTGNREIEPSRIEKIKKSIKANGWLHSPIIVNEKMEIIDGQGRFEALKSMNIPIEYFIIEGIGLKECVAFNNTQTKWTQADYIDSYADGGNESYKMLSNLLDEFSCLPQNTVIFTANGICGCDTKTMTYGNFKMTNEWYHESRRILTWLSGFSDLSKDVRGSRVHFLNALVFSFAIVKVDGEKMLTQCKNNFSKISAITDMNTALHSIEEMYNFRSRDHIYLVTEYDKYLRGKVAGYGKRWGDKKVRL